MLIHLYSNQQAYGDSDVWCGTDRQFQEGEVESTSEIGKVTCLDCLGAAREYGESCTVRKCELLDAAPRAQSKR